MIKYDCNKGKVALIAEGGIDELGADIFTLINTIYSDIYKENRKRAFQLELCIIAGLGYVFNSSMDGDADEE